MGAGVQIRLVYANSDFHINMQYIMGQNSMHCYFLVEKL